MGLHFQSEGWVPALAQSNGCYLFAIAAIPQVYHNIYLTDTSLIVVLERLQNSGAITSDYTIERAIAPWAIGELVSRYIGQLDYRLAEVGELTRDGVTYWPGVKSPRHNYAILWGQLQGGVEHKVLCDWTLREIYNPDPGHEIVVKQRYILYYYGTEANVQALYQ